MEIPYRSIQYHERLTEWSDEFDGAGTLMPPRLHLADRAAVLKLKHLFYF